tara:strand:+ start:158 stop:817 length:660 start_codon:yes stop_codon:yes gene_type:complete
MIMNTPQVSVIVPTYNHELYIGRCLRSLLKQSISKEDYEIIVVNDGSTDNTDKVIETFKNEIRYLENSENLGLAYSLNYGIKKARGQFIIRVDSDDYVHWDFLKILSMHLQMNHELDAVSCDYILVDNKQNEIKRLNSLKAPIGCGIMFKLKDLIEIGLYDEKFRFNEEKDLRIRFLKKFKISRVALPLYRYLMHSNNMSSDPKIIEIYDKILEEKHKG